MTVRGVAVDASSCDDECHSANVPVWCHCDGVMHVYHSASVSLWCHCDGVMHVYHSASVSLWCHCDGVMYECPASFIWTVKSYFTPSAPRHRVCVLLPQPPVSVCRVQFSLSASCHRPILPRPEAGVTTVSCHNVCIL